MSKTSNIGLCGEFYTMAKMFQEGLEPTLTLGNTKGVDILVRNPKTNKIFQVEVKTATLPKNKLKVYNSKLFGKCFEWQMSKKHEESSNDNLFFVFVWLSEPPKFFVIPNKSVAEYVKRTHQKWLNSEHKKKVKDTGIRIFRIKAEDSADALEPSKHENNWSYFKE